MQPATIRRFPETLRVKAPLGLNAAIDLAARRRHMASPAEWARQRLLDGLEAEGIVLRDSGRIDRIEPEARP